MSVKAMSPVTVEKTYCYYCDISTLIYFYKKRRKEKTMYEEERREERERGGVVRGVEVILHKSSTEYAGRRSVALSRALNAQIG